jgi:Fe-S cluster assembly iron-binding protein IscA
MAISLTSEAAEHVGRQLASRGTGEGIRIGVKTSGVLRPRLCARIC